MLKHISKLTLKIGPEDTEESEEDETESDED